MDIHLFLSTLPYLYPMKKVTRGSSTDLVGPFNNQHSSYMNQVLKHHQQVLDAISPTSVMTDGDRKEVSGLQHCESQKFGIYYKYLFTHHAVSIEPINGCTKKCDVGPAFFRQQQPDGELHINEKAKGHTVHHHHHQTHYPYHSYHDEDGMNDKNNEHSATDAIQYDPALFRFYAVVLSSTSFNSGYAKNHNDSGILSPLLGGIGPSSPAGSSVSTSMSRSESPKTPKVEQPQQQHGTTTATSGRRATLSSIYTPMKNSKIVDSAQPLLYFGFQKIPLQPSGKDNHDPSAISKMTHKFNPIQFYCVDHFQFTSIQVEEKENGVLRKEDIDSQNEENRRKKKGVSQPSCILFHFPSCSFRVFSSLSMPFHSSAPFSSVPLPQHKSMSWNSHMGTNEEYLYRTLDWIQRFIISTTKSFVSSSSVLVSHPSSTTLASTSWCSTTSNFSSYLHQLNESFMTLSSSILVETSSSSGPTEEAGQRIILPGDDILLASKGSDSQQLPPVENIIHQNDSRWSTTHATTRVVKRKMNHNNDDDEQQQKNLGNNNPSSIFSENNSWSMIDNHLFPTIQNQINNHSILPSHILQDVPYQLSFELTRTPSLLYSEQVVVRNIKSCEQHMEKILQSLFPTPKHRVVVPRHVFHRSSSSTTTVMSTTAAPTLKASSNDLQEMDGNRSEDTTSSTMDLEGKLQQCLNEYERLQKERNLLYLYPNRV